MPENVSGCTKSSFSIPKSQDFLFKRSLDFLYPRNMEIDIAKWIRDARITAGMSQEKLGEAIGRTKGNISAWENGRHEPSFQQLGQISKATGVQIPKELAEDMGWQGAVQPMQTVRETGIALDADYMNADDLLELITLYRQSTPASRKILLNFAKGVEKIPTESLKSISTD